MKLLKTDRGEGYVKIRIENQDDLWYLKDIIAKGDEVRALTQRTKLDGREKKTCTLTLETEKTEYQENRLRVTGEITEGADDIELGFHTFNLEPEQEFEMWKDFTNEEWERLEEAEEKRSYKVFFCLVEKGSADFYIVEESGIKDLSNVEENIPGKMYASDKNSDNFFNQVKEVVERSADDMDYIILCGPGNQKNKLKNMLSDDTVSKTMLQDTSVTGFTGLNEAIKRGALKKVVETSRIAEESEVMEEFLDRLNNDERVSYGDPVEDLIEQGAVETLIITAEKNRKNPELAKTVERMGGDVNVVHTDHEAGERLDNFGGLGALLRYQV
ncbi:mRNA surveillance protein pelota [Candidatus Nanohalovita haloferacivicina]|uniref:mRNA surveillance protein pelota n=1 Tax=Candidatus Nanohalovita haloferacivicina TaxID=2978046 RepID=UPI00325FA793|nr:mRNA surveillance protein pelota [Candidatus Nanohalobia archaeon BNXNv]